MSITHPACEVGLVDQSAARWRTQPARRVRRSGLGVVTALVLVAGLLLAGPGSSVAGAGTRYLDPVFSSVRIDNNQAYGRVKHPDGSVERLYLDLYRPAGDSRRNRPVLIFIHGGGSSSSKDYPRNRIIPKGLARRGFVAASINYRDGTIGSMPDAQHDTRAAVRWFKANAGRLRIDPRRIMLIGSSAGGMNALNVAFDPDDAGDSGHPGYSSTVAAAIAIGAAASEPQDIGTGEPPIAMIHATDDTTVPVAAARATCLQTTALGNVCEFFEYPEGGHPPGFIRVHLNRILEDSSRFVCRQVLGGC
jgi:acetyl esterase/lipase